MTLGKRWGTLAVVLCGALVIAGCAFGPWIPKGQSVLSGAFDSQRLIGELRRVFGPLEAQLAPGDHFDYEHYVFFDGTVNGTHEGVVFVKLAQHSPSFIRAKGLTADDWGFDPIPVMGVYVLPPNDCFRGMEAGVPYLIRATSPDAGDVVDARGVPARTLDDVGKNFDNDEPEWFWFKGNARFHAESCMTVGVNQK